MDWGAYVLSATIVWSSGPVEYHPSPPLDLETCQRISKQTNHEFIAAGLVGFATCVKAHDDP